MKDDDDSLTPELRDEMRHHALFYEQEEVVPVQNQKRIRDKSFGRKPIETSTLQEDTTMHEGQTTTKTAPHIDVRDANGAISIEQQAAESVRKLEHHVSTIHRQLIEANSMKREGIKLAVYATATAGLTVGGFAFVNWLMKPSAATPKVVVK